MIEYLDLISKNGILGLILVLFVIMYKIDIITYLTASDIERLFWNSSKKYISKFVHRILFFVYIWISMIFLGSITRTWNSEFMKIIFILMLLLIFGMICIFFIVKYKKYSTRSFTVITNKIHLYLVIILFIYMIWWSNYIYTYNLEHLSVEKPLFIIINSLVLSMVALEGILIFVSVIDNKSRYYISIKNDMYEICEVLSNGIIVLINVNDNSIILINDNDILKNQITKSSL